MVREAEEKKERDDGMMKSKGREMYLRNRQIDGDKSVVEVAAQLLHRLSSPAAPLRFPDYYDTI